MVRLGDVCSIIGGGTPNRSIPEYWNGNIPWVTVKDFISKRIKSTQESITEIGVKESATNIIKKGNILIPTRMALGKIAICDIDVTINQDIKALLIKDDRLVDVNYLCYFYESQASNIESQGKGATVKGITLDVLNDLQIPLPPLPIQKRIAEILDAADALRRKDQELLQKYDALAQAIFLDMFGDPVKNEKGWEVKKLEDITTKLGDGLHGTPKYTHDGDYYFINGNNLENGFIKFDESTKRVSEDEYLKHKKELNKNTMLVSINGTIGKVAFYRGEKIILGKSACYFNFNREKVSSVYLYSILKSPFFLAYAGDKATGSTIKNVSLKTMREFPVMLPPIADQIKFEGIVQKIWASKTMIEKANKLDFFQTLLQKAFKGELVS